MGSTKNILEDTPFENFFKRYPAFHQKLLKATTEKKLYSDQLLSCLAYLEVNYRQMALDEIENCILIDGNDADLIAMKALIYWSMMDDNKGYRQFWEAYKIDKKNY